MLLHVLKIYFDIFLQNLRIFKKHIQETRTLPRSFRGIGLKEKLTDENDKMAKVLIEVSPCHVVSTNENPNAISVQMVKKVGVVI